ncbi:hypothetical protein AFLA70_65g003631 [Aspergillus flavus AF70]|nr:hypothetical protein AFLA70_65g003631 [Aspergillus flavus AF70]
MKYDGVAWEPSDNVFTDFKDMVISHEVLLAVTNFMASYREGVRPVDRARIADLGAFSLCFRVMFPEEKVQNEVAIMTYLQQNTKIPVPKIIHHGTSEDSPAGLGPFVLMEYVGHASNLATQLRAPGYQRGDRPFLDPDNEEEKLEFFYSQIADILLEFSKPSFDKIGSLARDANWLECHQPPVNHEYERASSAGKLSSQDATQHAIYYCFGILSEPGRDRVSAFSNTAQ